MRDDSSCNGSERAATNLMRKHSIFKFGIIVCERGSSRANTRNQTARHHIAGAYHFPQPTRRLPSVSNILCNLLGSTRHAPCKRKLCGISATLSLLFDVDSRIDGVLNHPHRNASDEIQRKSMFKEFPFATHWLKSGSACVRVFPRFDYAIDILIETSNTLVCSLFDSLIFLLVFCCCCCCFRLVRMSRERGRLCACYTYRHRT